MRTYKVGLNYTTLPSMAKNISERLGFKNDKKVQEKIYRYLLNDIKCNEVKALPHKFGMYKININQELKLTKRYKKIL